MKKYLILTIGIATALAVVSCHERNEELLGRADALVYTMPDSSLALLREVDTASLHDDATRAYYALLWTQTAYRTGQFELADDSLAHAALAYYQHHPEENEWLVRAMIYLGLHQEIHDQPEEAMSLYKQAEATVDTTDYRNLAQINYRIGQLMSNFNAQNHEDLRRYEKALHYYRLVGDTLQLVYSLLGTGALQRDMGID